MNQLTDLKVLFETNKIKIEKFDGWSLKTKEGDVWTLSLGIFYKNGSPINENELINSFKPKKNKPPKEPKPKRFHKKVKK